jgi:hypothetical protein
MKRRFIFISLWICSVGQMAGQESQIWNQFKQQRIESQESCLPDFSYAGYQRGESSFPDVEHEVFDVTDFGAIPNDSKSDKLAIQKAVAAAVKKKSGIVFFPKGRFLVNEDSDEPTSIVINGSHIVFRGSGSGPGGTEIFMKNHLPAKDPKKLWTVPYMFQFVGKGKESLITEVVQNAKAGDKSLVVKEAVRIQAGDWVVLRVKNNAPDLIESEMCGCEVDKAWTSILNKGVYVNEYHQVKSVDGNVVSFWEPVLKTIDKAHEWQVFSCSHYEEVGVEDIAFIGNWHDDFVHHKDYIHDGGFSIVKFSRLTNSWINRCRFTDVNRAVNVGLSANVSVLNCKVTGIPGHSSLSSNASTRVLIGNCVDSSSQWHAPGVAGPSIGTVIWRVSYNEDTSFESHASQPRATLFDCVEGGFFSGRAGGARQNLPNHMEYLVLWNYKELGEADENFEFWSSKTWFWKILPPFVIGFHGVGTTFNESQIKVLESLGKPVEPESLYEAQLKLRLGALPQWVNSIKANL